ncbi:MAG: hypothetical protein KDE20_10660 [Caldilineaceae bacterium]|nr:hypothetical protein [Caldilineaceae bacterium]
MIIKNGATPTLILYFVSTADYYTAAEGVAPVVEISKAGGAFAAATNSPATEISDGFYKIALTATETNTDGIIAVRAYVDASGSPDSDYSIWIDTHEVTSGVPILIDDTTAAALMDRMARRHVADIESSSDGDTLDLESLYGLLCKMVVGTQRTGSSLEILKTDKETVLGTQTVGTGSGDPITSVVSN